MVKLWMFYEIVVAPNYSEKGLEILRGISKTLRIFQASKNEKGKISLRQVGDGWLAQDSDDLSSEDIQFNVVSKKSPQESELNDAEFAWLCVKHVKSNAIVIAKMSDSEFEDKIFSLFKDIMTRIAKFKELEPVGSTFLNGFQHALGNSILNELECLLEDASGATQDISLFQDNNLGDKLNEQACINEKDEIFSPCSRRNEVICVLMAVIYSMVKQEYMMQERVVSICTKSQVTFRRIRELLPYVVFASLHRRSNYWSCLEIYTLKCYWKQLLVGAVTLFLLVLKRQLLSFCCKKGVECDGSII